MAEHGQHRRPELLVHEAVRDRIGAARNVPAKWSIFALCVRRRRFSVRGVMCALGKGQIQLGFLLGMKDLASDKNDLSEEVKKEQMLFHRCSVSI